MIFGFNTDIKHGDTVYHVQSEARENELLLQTQVFVRGRCIGKRATPMPTSRRLRLYRSGERASPARPASPGARCHSRRPPGQRSGSADSPETLAAIKELDVQWLNADSAHSERILIMRLRVTEGGAAVPGARLTVRFARPDAAPFYTQALTDAVGDAEMKIDVDESALPDSSFLVQASYSGRTATRKFQLRKVEA